jgi:hypothetical protein
MNTNWYGLLEGDLQDAIGFIDDSENPRRIIGSKADHHAAPYSLTEEFVSVYRMHPLMPDEIIFKSLATGRALETRKLEEDHRPPHAGGGRARDDAGSVLFVRRLAPGCRRASQLPEDAAEPAPRRW